MGTNRQESPWPGRVAVLGTIVFVAVMWRINWLSMDGPWSYRMGELLPRLSVPSFVLLFAAGYMQTVASRFERDGGRRHVRERAFAGVRGAGLAVCALPHFFIAESRYFVFTWGVGLGVALLAQHIVPRRAFENRNPALRDPAGRAEAVSRALTAPDELPPGAHQMWDELTAPGGPVVKALTTLAEHVKSPPPDHIELRTLAREELAHYRRRLNDERPRGTDKLVIAIDAVEELVRSL